MCRISRCVRITIWISWIVQDVKIYMTSMNNSPMPWFTYISQCHRFYLSNNTDYLYNASGLATMRAPTGQSGSHVGDEIDFRANFHVSRHQDLLVSYSKLFSGNYLAGR